MTKNESKVEGITGAAPGIGSATESAMREQGFQVAGMNVAADGLHALVTCLQPSKASSARYIVESAAQ